MMDSRIPMLNKMIHLNHTDTLIQKFENYKFFYLLIKIFNIILNFNFFYNKK